MTRKNRIRNEQITMPITRKRPRWQRNWPCVCGSGKKFKSCCLSQSEIMDSLDGNQEIKEDS